MEIGMRKKTLRMLTRMKDIYSKEGDMIIYFTNLMGCPAKEQICSTSPGGKSRTSGEKHSAQYNYLSKTIFIYTCCLAHYFAKV